MKMLMEPKYIRRRRVAFGLALALGLAFVWALVQVSGNLWWTSEGYCWGDFFECHAGVFGE